MKADKYIYIYKINLFDYHKILMNKITDTYKIDYNNTISQINNDTFKFANKLRGAYDKFPDFFRMGYQF